jgi:hypothetical protein
MQADVSRARSLYEQAIELVSLTGVMEPFRDRRIGATG